MTQTRTPSLDTHDERPRRSHSGTLGWDTNKRLIAGHVRERGSDHVNVPTAPGAGHEEPVFPWDHADFRHHVLRLVREYVPAIMEELHTIADRSDLVLSPRALFEYQIRPDIDACATRWPLEKPWLTRTMHRTVRWWHLSPAMRAHRQWAPVLPENGWGSRRSWRRRKAIQYRGFKPTPTSKIQEAELFHWWARYHLRHERYETIASDPHPHRQATVRIAVRRLVRELDLPLRKGRPGRPRTRQI